MARFLALDGETARLQLLSATVKGGSVRLDQSAVWDEDQPIAAASAQATGQRLREHLRDAGISPAPLLVCVGRERVIIKDIKIPDVPAHEQPGIVRFQAMKEFSEGGDESVLDFVPIGATSGGELRVQVVSIKKDVLNAYRTMAEAAGLTLAAVTPRPFAMLAGLRHAISGGQAPPPEPADGAVAVLVRGEKWGEFTVARAGVILQARSLAGPALTSELALIGEIRRNLAIHANHSPDQPVRALYLAEPDSPGGLRERLQSALALPVHAYEPLIGVSVPDGPLGGLAGPAGLCALRADGAELPINFVQPRQPRAPRDPGKRLLVIAGAAAACALLFFALFAYLHVSSKNTELTALLGVKNQNDDILRANDADVRRLKALDDWAATDVNWLDELYDMTARFDDGRSMRVTSFTTSPLDDRTGKSKLVAAISLKIISTGEHPPIDQLKGKLSTEPAYRLSAMKEKPNPAIERQRFRLEYDGRIELEKRPVDKYTRTFTATPPPRRARGGDDGMGLPGMMGGFAP